MKYYIIAGEASGDLHGSNLIKELKLLDADCNIRAWGGDKMQAAGATLVKHYRDLAFMGFVEVAMNLRAIFKNITCCKNDISVFKPDVVILIDYPGFNLRIAEWAKKNGLRVVYYISPQVWAWKEKRALKMRKIIDKLLVILPFEKDFYKNKFGWNVDYVGNPLVSTIDDFKKEHNRQPSLDNKKTIALLPGSRKQEVSIQLPIMLKMVDFFPDEQFIIAQAPSLDDDFYQPFLKNYSNVSIVKNQTYALLSNASAAIVTSGTATLETALFGVPQVVCYKGNSVSYQIAKRLVKVKYISLVNLIMDKPVVKELIQYDLTTENLRNELQLLLHDKARQTQIQSDYQQLRNKLSVNGNASANAVKIIVEFLRTK
jgi:lipid-A-disaccharide synthase